MTIIGNAGKKKSLGQMREEAGEKIDLLKDEQRQSDAASADLALRKQAATDKLASEQAAETQSAEKELQQALDHSEGQTAYQHKQVEELREHIRKHPMPLAPLPTQAQSDTDRGPTPGVVNGASAEPQDLDLAGLTCLVAAGAGALGTICCIAGNSIKSEAMIFINMSEKVRRV